MKSYVYGGVYGAIFGGLMAGLFILSQYLGAYMAQGDSFGLRVMKDVSEIFLIPAFPLMGWGVPLSIFIVGTLIIYFLIGVLVLGKYFRWREINQSSNFISKHFSGAVLLFIMVIIRTIHMYY